MMLASSQGVAVPTPNPPPTITLFTTHAAHHKTEQYCSRNQQTTNRKNQHQQHQQRRSTIILTSVPYLLLPMSGIFQALNSAKKRFGRSSNIICITNHMHVRDVGPIRLQTQCKMRGITFNAANAIQNETSFSSAAT